MPGGYVTLDAIDLNEIWYGCIVPAVDGYRRVDLPMITSLAMTWPEQIMKYGLTAANGFQLLAPGERPTRKFVEVATAYPFVDKYGYGVGSDLDTIQRSTGREVAMAFNRPMMEDPENVLVRFLERMMIDPGAANVGGGFYNGEFATAERITAPPRYGQQIFNANHTHYIASNTSATLDLDDFTEMKQTILHHGHRGQLMAFINSNGAQALEDLASWNSATITRSPISDMVSVDGFGQTFQLLGITFHVTEMMPTGYVLMVEGNNAQSERPLIMFEPANIRGLRMHPGPMNDYPLVEAFFDRWFGVKVWQRGAGVCLFYGTHSGSYVDPTFTTVP